MLSQEFIQHALIAGSAVAACCGFVGYFLVLRSQMFSGDALSHVSYTGSIAALSIGLDARIGLFATTIVAGLGLGVLGGRKMADDVVIGTAFSWILGLGALFLYVYTTSDSTGNGLASVTVLFGSIFGMSTDATLTATLVALAIVAAMASIGRPLLFSSIDPGVAASRGVPVRTLGLVFLGLVGATAAEASQVVGAIMLLGLLAAPAAAARRLTSRPWPGVAASVAFAVVSVWIGILFSYLVPECPVSLGIVATAGLLYAGAALFSMSRWRHPGEQ